MSGPPNVGAETDRQRAYELYRLAWSLANAEVPDLARAVATMEEAVLLEPGYELELSSLRWFVDRRSRGVGKVSLPRAVNKILTPLLSLHGFAVILPLEGEKRSWRQGCVFQRCYNNKHQTIGLASARFGGKRLEFLVSAETSPGTWVHRDNRDFGYAHESLSYLNQAELQGVCGLLANLLKSNVLPWLQQL